MTKTGKATSSLFKISCIRPARMLLWIGMVLFLSAGPVGAADIQLTASVDKRELTLEDSVNFSITVEGASSAPQPELPSLDSFSVRSSGSSSSLQIINGERTSSITYNFLLIPKTTGTFTLSPVAVTIDGTTYRTKPITLIVKKPSKAAKTSKEVWVELRVSNRKPYVQEQVTATLRVFHKIELRNLGANLQYPGFREEKLKGPVRTTRVLNGIQYQVFEIPTALFPLRPGTIEIPSGLIEFDQVDSANRKKAPDTFNPFGQGSIFDKFRTLKHKTLRTEAITLDVQPLPKKNRPANFSNLVGEFNISARLSRPDVEVGDTITLTVTIAGRGNIRDLALLAPDWGENFKAYEDQSEYRQTHNDPAIAGERVYTFALVPRVPGDLQVPPVALTYFDPKKSDYVSIQSSSLPISVLPGKGDSQLKIVEPDAGEASRNGNSIKKLGEDILPIHTGAEIFEDQSFARSSSAFYGLGMVFPAALFFIYAWNYQHRQRLKHDIAFSRSHGAYPRAIKQLDALTQEEDPRNRARELSSIVRQYLGNILNLQGTAITATEVGEKLRSGNFSAEEIDAVQKLLEKYESLQYASTPADSSKDLIGESRNLITRLEKKS